MYGLNVASLLTITSVAGFVMLKQNPAAILRLAVEGAYRHVGLDGDV